MGHTTQWQQDSFCHSQAVLFVCVAFKKLFIYGPAGSLLLGGLFSGCVE